ncbi:DUF3331 domain-containing protein [Paraburkholderia caballeronis]|uniref:DUF3331 domain-containing protein n=1 Tax=Paraburkholderia caballeronis TaxID=416943 RepID=A0A1H7L5N0_9BURK|nr:DUF3331 domain-containing protein [Paraburkholderia caballeronis]PXW28304.1 uncharacterized protein DUF3331 [Paraburkholderia caballeronis]PXX03670.1 uncharacterized protein DUF3331 [Paraburkholderia caballeronis]RAK04414.1 uncharacterized protein DUF3331 [Paraburkholderia caballeronis]SED81142.1 protein of unknown function [Paraburkholderia caballeronis]SEK94268.1 protein of unknown function [Paraburkholderia caballeronis]
MNPGTKRAMCTADALVVRCGDECFELGHSMGDAGGQAMERIDVSAARLPAGDVWRHVTRALRECSDATAQQYFVEHLRRQPDDSSANFVMRVLERKTDTSVLVTWRDATRCRYDDQVWQRVISRRSGVCVLSGQAITRGDAIYRPKKGRHWPSNAHCMILAVVLDAADGLSPAKR